MKLSKFSAIAINTLALMFLAPAIAFSQPADRLQLNLTDAQKQQMKSIHQNTRTQISALLTDAQKIQLETAIKSGTKPREAMRALNLSADQKSKIRAIKQAERTQREALLTPEQKQKITDAKGKRPRPNFADEQK